MIYNTFSKDSSITMAASKENEIKILQLLVVIKRKKTELEKIYL